MISSSGWRKPEWLSNLAFICSWKWNCWEISPQNLLNENYFTDTMRLMMADKIRVGVIFGGRSGEHEVSLMSARSVLSVLDPQKYTVTQIGITHDGAWVTGENVWQALNDNKTTGLDRAVIFGDPSRPGLYRVDAAGSLSLVTPLDVIFPVLHGTFGEDGTLQGLLEMADVAYVGAGVLGSSVGMDKALFKDVMRTNGVPVTESILVTRAEIQNQIKAVMEKAEAMSAYPLFVKPVNLGSSVGITKCSTPSDLYEGLMDAARFDRRVLVEHGVSAREIEVSVLGNDDPQASIPGEIVPAADFYSYEAKYLDDRSQLLIPAPIPDETAARVRELAVRAYKAADIAGMARVDFLLDKNTGELFLNEINTIPGFTRISMYPKLWEATGLPYPALVDRLIELALQRKADRDQTERQYRREG
jgi:D-alanine-D-alanine ligase